MNPIEPVSLSSIVCDESSVDLVYNHFNLDYYQNNYIHYFTFVNTPQFHAMKASIRNETKVCYNVEVKNSSGFPMGAFTCPQTFEDEDLTSCCGDPCAQFCCTSNFYTDSDRNLNTLAFFLILISAAGLGLLFYFILGNIF